MEPLGKSIQKAVIPVAGRATRLGALGAVLPKSLLPLPSTAGEIRPVIDFICREASQAGIDEVALIVSPSQQSLFAAYFDEARKCSEVNLPGRIEYIVQKSPAGFGDAVLLAKDFAANRPFALLLGDHVYQSARGSRPCAAQVIEAASNFDAVAMIGVQPVGPDQLGLVGVAAGEPVTDQVYRCTAFIEKPELETARSSLATAGLQGDQFLGHCGIYIFGPEIFECLSDLAGRDRPAGSEVELSAAQSMLLDRYPERYYLFQIAGQAFDVGTQAGYIQTFNALSAS